MVGLAQIYIEHRPPSVWYELSPYKVVIRKLLIYIHFAAQFFLVQLPKIAVKKKKIMLSQIWKAHIQLTSHKKKQKTFAL